MRERSECLCCKFGVWGLGLEVCALGLGTAGLRAQDFGWVVSRL